MIDWFYASVSVQTISEGWEGGRKSEGEAKFPLDNFQKKRRMVRVFWKK